MKNIAIRISVTLIQKPQQPDNNNYRENSKNGTLL